LLPQRQKWSYEFHCTRQVCRRQAQSHQVIRSNCKAPKRTEQMIAPKREPKARAVSSPSEHGKRVRGDLHWDAPACPLSCHTIWGVSTATSTSVAQDTALLADCEVHRQMAVSSKSVKAATARKLHAGAEQRGSLWLRTSGCQCREVLVLVRGRERVRPHGLCV